MLFAGAITVVSLVLWARLSPDPDQSVHVALRDAEAQTIFLFDGLDLVDCTPPARRIMKELARGGSDLQRLFRALSSRFGGLPSAEAIENDGFEGEFRASDPADDLRLRFDSWDGYLRATLTQGPSEDEQSGDESVDGLSPGGELTTLRSVTDETPYLLWQTDASGQIEWANEAYFAEMRSSGIGEPTHWPPAPLFPALQIDPPAKGMTRRVTLGEGDKLKGFDVCCVTRGRRTFFFASSAQAIMKAESTQREFVQTLTKTFAHLSIGLAIFDRNRRLALFNPALLDLIRRPVEFLSQQPTLNGFLDRLREEKLMAEPKDYKAWRKQIVDLEAKAVNGSYCETWSLPGGLTFRVTGRPHPDGAIAFLFEDISAEMSLTQRFHAEIELGHAALDAMEEAVLVVNAAGVVSLTNKAYRALWENEPDETLIVQRLRDVVHHWIELSEASSMWDALIAAAERRGGPSEWRGEVTMADGRALRCRTQRLRGGATLIGFRTVSPHLFLDPRLAARRKRFIVANAGAEERAVM